MKMGNKVGLPDLASVPEDDKVEGEEEFDQAMCILCPRAPSAKITR